MVSKCLQTHMIHDKNTSEQFMQREKAAAKESYPAIGWL